MSGREEEICFKSVISPHWIAGDGPRIVSAGRRGDLIRPVRNSEDTVELLPPIRVSVVEIIAKKDRLSEG
jgi:hypothetical protein